MRRVAQPVQVALSRPLADTDAPAVQRRGGPSSSSSSSAHSSRHRPCPSRGPARAAGAVEGGGGRGCHAAGGVGEVPRRPPPPERQPGEQPGGQPHGQAPAAGPAPARRFPRAAHRPHRPAPGRRGGGVGRQHAGGPGGGGQHPHPGLPAGQRLHPPHRRRRVPLPLGAALRAPGPLTPRPRVLRTRRSGVCCNGTPGGAPRPATRFPFSP